MTDRKDALVADAPAAVERPHPLDEDIGFLAAKATAVAVAAANRGLAGVGLRVRSYAVLALACDEVPRTQKELADYLVLDPSQIVTLLDDLERDELVRRVPDPGDRRARLIVATPSGHDRFQAAQRLAETANDATLARLSTLERQTLLALLQRII